ncbi:MAG: FAD-binding oxidoreductase [Gomphosphaeria aponina SAG 52.96 = DSM 107014]|uniref:FAD-binding oxidoreductase n=1 Tax=Gomphosphaeria aponina SAG 52.96 = DSM 107014 TaxID=1521640 RepID=A0A941GUK5_9CHRO|nr:FAD-binding oxidoreductase [Gomphosphaeria aponina SAG 52.96 = DSM 107014]
MNQEYASKIEGLSDSNLEIINWEHTPPEWQEKLKNTLATPPNYLIYPHNNEALAKIIKLANKHGLTVMPCGSGSKLNWGGLRQDIDLVVSTQKLNQIIDHAVGDLTVTVEAGLKLKKLQEILQQAGQFLPLDPAYPHDATVGGIVATADAGSWRQRYGGVRDMLLGVSFIRADGEMAKAGGRVVKNVAGYDLMKLFTGSYGTLGIISQLTFRVYPLLSSSTTVVLIGEQNAIATAHQTLLKSSLTPTAADLLSASLVQGLNLGVGMGLIVGFQSIRESVQAQANDLETMGKNLGLTSSLYRDRDEENLWERLREIMTISGSDRGITCKIGTLPNAAVKILGSLNQGLGMIHGSSGLGRLYLESEVSVVKKMRSLCVEHQGFLSILTAPAVVKKQVEPWGYQGNALKIMQQIKQQFDPQNILNPGVFVGGI